MARKPKIQAGEDQPQWTVHMKVERNISVTVEADTEEEARAKAVEWDIVGDEMPGDTINMEVTGARRD